MGFLSRLFGQQPQKNIQIVQLEGQGKFLEQVVGESFYQENLSKICGGRKKDGVENITTAELVYADDNPHDDKAIRIEISGMPVGHLSRSEARYFRDRMLAKGHAGLTATCKAKITGGWDRGDGDIGNFGVTLDLPTEFVESISNTTAITNSSEQSMGSNIISFYVEKSSAQELEQCQIGDYVNLWIPKGDSQKVCIFRRGSCGGAGKLGWVPEKYSSVIHTHLSKEFECETEIIEINVEKIQCKIKCKLVSQEETSAKQAALAEATANRLRTELQKRYTPKNSLSIKVQLPKDHKLKVGQELYLEKHPLEYYVQNALGLQINFVDNNGILAAKKDNEPALIRNILRAFFSQYAMRFQISSIETPDEYTMKHIDIIEAKVEVSFEKDT